MENFERLGIFGGTFDPIHNGHISSVLDSAQRVMLEQVLMIPAYIPVHKNAAVANSHHRLAMVQLVCQHHAIFQADDRELKRSKPSYTIDTLNEISALYPNKQLFLFVGLDSLLSFTQWYQWQEILTLCHLIVSARPLLAPIAPQKAIDKRLTSRIVDDVNSLANKKAGKILINQLPDYPISSTQIRKQLNQNKPIDNDVPSYIKAYIDQHQLYQHK
ncbi:nicotinate-nucleotide adenylyltransferase [Thalassotalea ganghwensis]